MAMRLKCLCGIALTMLGGMAFAGTDGPFGGSVTKLWADPVVATRIYAFTTNGFFRSDDSATTWTRAETGLGVGDPVNGIFELSTATPGTAWIFDDTGTLYRSTDYAAHWVPTGFKASLSIDTADTIAEGDNGKLWFAGNLSGLMRSIDGGTTFQTVSGNGFPAGVVVTFVATDPHDRSHVIANTTTGCPLASGSTTLHVCAFYNSSDGGVHWTQTTLNNPNPPQFYDQVLNSLSCGPAGSNRIYGTVAGAIASQGIGSSDAGLTWATIATESPLTASPTEADTVWSASGGKSTNAGQGFDNRFNPVFNNGQLFGFTINGNAQPYPLAIALSSDYHAGIGHLFIGTSFAGLYVSTDDGVHWAPSNTGISAAEIDAIAVNPADHSRVYAGFGDFISSTYTPAFYRLVGGDWQLAVSGMQADAIQAIVIDPTTAANPDTTVMLAGGIGGVDPDYYYDSGIYKSTDGGANWSALEGGFDRTKPSPYDTVYSMVVDPRSCDARATTAPVCTTGPLLKYYAAGTGYLDRPNHDREWRVKKTVDGGSTWTNIDANLPQDRTDPDGVVSNVGVIPKIVIDPQDYNTLYIGAFAFSRTTDSQFAVPRLNAGVYKSTNAGGSWTAMETGLPTYSATGATLSAPALAVDPANGQTLWVAMGGTEDGNATYLPVRIYKTTDGGAHWTNSSNGLTGIWVNDILPDPDHPGTIYASASAFTAADPGGVFRSLDGGANWASISVGLPAVSVYSLTLVPKDPNDPDSVPVLYAGTSGGVFSLPVLPDSDGDGVPDAVENAGPNSGDSNHDGIADSTQATVSVTAPGLADNYGWQPGADAMNITNAVRSLKSRLQTMKAANAAAQTTTPNYLSLHLEGATCRQIAAVAQPDVSELSVDSVPHHGTYTYPYGAVRFELPNCSAATLDAAFNGATFGPGWSWRYFGPATPGDVATIGWHDATSLVQSHSGITWQFALQFGAFGTYRSFGPPSILFEGGPAYNDVVFNDGFQ